MFAGRSLIWGLLFLACGLKEAHAQPGRVGPSEERLAVASALRESHRGIDIRWDLETGAPARVWLPEDAPLAGASAVDAADELLRGSVGRLLEPGLVVSRDSAPARGRALVFVKTVELGRGRVRVDYAEFEAGLRVLDSSLQVELAETDRGFAPRAINAHYHPGIEAIPVASGAVESSLAARFPDEEIGIVRARTSWEKVVVARGPFESKVAFSVTVSERGDVWRVLVDAADGTEIARARLSLEGSATGFAYAKDPGTTPLSPLPLPYLYVDGGATEVTTDVAGNDSLSGSVTLAHDGLSGPIMHVFVDGGQPGLTYSGPSDMVLDFGDASPHTDEIAAWYHMMSYSSYMTATYPGLTQAQSIRYGAVCLSSSQVGWFYPIATTIQGESFPAYIVLGSLGGRSVSRDSTAVRHEYTHALLNGIAFLYSTNEAQGINEGLADYFPCAQAESPYVAAYVQPPYLRSLLDVFVWPQDQNGDPHRVGNILAGALWEARTRADAIVPGDRLKIDQTALAAVLRMPLTPTLLDARDAIVQADGALNGGAYTTLLEQCLFEHGIGAAPVAAGPPPPPPVFSALANATATVGATLALPVSATDPSGLPVTLAASPVLNAQLGQTATSPAAGTWTFLPQASQVGTFPVTFTATDGKATASATIRVTVKLATTPAPVAGSGTAPTTTRSTSTTPASTAAAPNAGSLASGGGGSGGCALAPASSGGPPTILPVFAALSLVFAARWRMQGRTTHRRDA
jgi:hypothetical protein